MKSNLPLINWRYPNTSIDNEILNHNYLKVIKQMDILKWIEIRITEPQQHNQKMKILSNLPYTYFLQSAFC